MDGDRRVCARLVGVAAFAYTGLMVTVTVQAFRGQALIHPDGRTLRLAAGFAAISCVALAVVVAAAHRVGVRHATVEAKQFERLGL